LREKIGKTAQRLFNAVKSALNVHARPPKS